MLVEHPGARFVGAPSPQEVVEQAATRVALLEEHLPAMTPTDFGLVTSKVVTTEVYNIAVGGRSGFGPVAKDLARGAVAAAVAISTVQQIAGLDGDIRRTRTGATSRTIRSSTPRCSPELNGCCRRTVVTSR